MVLSCGGRNVPYKAFLLAQGSSFSDFFKLKLNSEIKFISSIMQADTVIHCDQDQDQDYSKNNMCHLLLVLAIGAVALNMLQQRVPFF